MSILADTTISFAESSLVPLALGFFGLGTGYLIANGEKRRFTPRADLIGAVVFAGLYWLSGYLPGTNVVKLAVLLTGAVLLWLLNDRLVGTIGLGLVAAVLGPTTEIILVHLGAFAHLQPDFAGIPMWLPALYVASAPGVAPLVAWLGYGGEERSTGG